MSALLLLSYGLGAVPEFVERHRREVGRTAGRPRVGFIDAASNIYPKAPWVDDDRSSLARFGYELVEIDLTTLRGDALEDALHPLDALYVAGGNTFNLLHHVRESGLDRILPAHLSSGLLYVGASAGAVIVGPDIEPITPMDDPAEAPPLSSTRGLGLVDFVPLPHADGQLPPYPPGLIAQIVAQFGDKFPLQAIADDRAALVVNGTLSVVPSAIGTD